jgi:hypothetical protein
VPAVGQPLDRVLDQLGVVPVPRAHRQRTGHHVAVEVPDLALNLDFAELVALPFLDHERDDEVALVRSELSHGRHDPEIGVAVAQIERAQLLLVIREAIGIVAGGGTEDLQQAGSFGHQLAA